MSISFDAGTPRHPSGYQPPTKKLEISHWSTDDIAETIGSRSKASEIPKNDKRVQNTSALCFAQCHNCGKREDSGLRETERGSTETRTLPY